MSALNQVRPPCCRIEREHDVLLAWDDYANAPSANCVVSNPRGKYLFTIRRVSRSSMVTVGGGGPLFTGNTEYTVVETGKVFVSKPTTEPSGIEEAIIVTKLELKK